MKFGGTSVEDAAAIRRLCQLVARPSAQRPVVVVSALAKVTDQLMNAGWAAAAGRPGLRPRDSPTSPSNGMKPWPAAW